MAPASRSKRGQGQAPTGDLQTRANDDARTIGDENKKIKGAVTSGRMEAVEKKVEQGIQQRTPGEPGWRT